MIGRCWLTWAKCRAQCLVSHPVLLHEFDRGSTAQDKRDNQESRSFWYPCTSTRIQVYIGHRQKKGGYIDLQCIHTYSILLYLNVSDSESHCQKKRYPSFPVEARYLKSQYKQWWNRVILLVHTLFDTYVYMYMYITCTSHAYMTAPALLDGWRRELNWGHMTLMPGKNSQGSRRLCTPDPHRLVQTPRGNHSVVIAKRYISDFGRVSPKCGKKLACLAGPYLQEIIICTLWYMYV